METYYVPIYDSGTNLSDGPVYNFKCQADDREHALEQADDSIKDEDYFITDNVVWQFNNPDRPELGIKEV